MPYLLVLVRLDMRYVIMTLQKFVFCSFYSCRFELCFHFHSVDVHKHHRLHDKKLVVIERMDIGSGVNVETGSVRYQKKRF